MCGIAGLYSPDGSVLPAAVRADLVEAMLARIAHRGPDEAGVYADPRLALGAVRLKVLDLEGGQQPMLDASGRWCLAYNGEVYNAPELRAELQAQGHLFRGHGDTEVVLQAWIAWGPAALPRLEGGFAFALWDRRERELVLARDRFGKRPLFHAWHEGALLFASEMKAFLALPGFHFRWDEPVLASMAAQWTCIEDETPYAGVRQLRPGAWARVQGGRLDEQRWAGWPTPQRSATMGPDEAAARTRELLTAAVQRRLRSDVEVGVMLSGGLDSSIVTTLVREHQPGRLRSYSVGFEQAAYDESADQRLVADALGVDHRPLTVSTDDIAAHFDIALWHAEVPQFRTAFVPMYLLARAIRADGVPVVLSGEGADEVFLGYDLFRETRLRAQWPGLSEAQRQQRLMGLYPYLPHFNASNAAALAAVFGRSTTGSSEALFPFAMRLENGQFAQRLLRDAAGRPPSIAAAAEAAGIAAWPPVDRAQWLEVSTLLQGYLLSSQGDRMVFAHGVEPRNPFLAPAVVDAAATWPETHHLGEDGVEKRLLKQAFGARLPPRIVAKPKQPYRAPDAGAFLRDGRLRPEVRDALAPDRLAAVAPLDAAHAARLVARWDSGRPTSPREDQALVLLLSLVLLDARFVRGEARDVVGRLAPVRRQLEPAWAE